MATVTDGLVDKVETKVVASSAGAGGGAVVAGFALYLTGVYVYGASATANSGADAVAAVPAPVSAFAFFLLSIAGAWFAGRAAPHTSRTVVELPPVVAPTDPSHEDSGEGNLAGADVSDGEVQTSFEDDDTPG